MQSICDQQWAMLSFTNVSDWQPDF